MSGAVTAIAAVVATKAVVDMVTPSRPAPQQPAQQAAPVTQPAPQAPQPVVQEPAQQQAAAPDAANVLYRGMEGNDRQAMSPQATRARRGGGASGATMLSGPRGVEGQSMALSGGSTLLGS